MKVTEIVTEKKLFEVGKVTHENIVDTLKLALAAEVEHQVPFVWGTPGIGKTEIIKQVARELGWELRELDLSAMEPEDLLGLPSKRINQKTGREESYYIPNPTVEEIYEYSKANPNTQILLFLDELNNATPQVLRIAYHILLGKKIGNLKLPDNVHIIAAGNPASLVKGGKNIPQALLDRSINLHLTVDEKSWLKFARRSNYHSIIISYIMQNPGDLNRPPDIEDESRRLSSIGTDAYPNPRNWSGVNSLLSAYEKRTSQNPESRLDPRNLSALEATIQGRLGEGWGSKFFHYYAAYLAKQDEFLRDEFDNMVNQARSNMFNR